MALTKAQRSEAAKKAAATRKKNEKAATTQKKNEKAQKKEVSGAKTRAARKEVGETGQQAEGLSEYKPRHKPLGVSKLDQTEIHEKRQAELQAERDKHNKLTGDVSRQGWNH